MGGGSPDIALLKGDIESPERANISVQLKRIARWRRAVRFQLSDDNNWKTFYPTSKARPSTAASKLRPTSASPRTFDTVLPEMVDSTRAVTVAPLIYSKPAGEIGQLSPRVIDLQRCRMEMVSVVLMVPSIVVATHWSLIDNNKTKIGEYTPPHTPLKF